MAITIGNTTLSISVSDTSSRDDTKAILIQDERYLLAVLRYVHQNPVVAGFCSSATDYRYSSDADYRKNRHWLADIDLILHILDSLMAQEDHANYEELDVIGDDSFTLASDASTRTPQRKQLDEILLDTGLSVNDYNLIKAGSRRRYLTSYKRLYVKAALEQKYTLREIGANIGFSSVAVAKMLRG